MMFSSIRVKLTLWYIGVLALIIVAFAIVTYSLLLSALEKETNENLTEIARTLSASIQSEQSNDEAALIPDEAVKEALDEFRFNDYQFAVFTSGDGLVAKTTDAELPKGLGNDLDPEGFGNIDINGKPFRTFFTPFVIAGHGYKLYTFHSLDDQNDLKARIRSIFYLVAPLLLILAGLGGYFLARKSLKPIAAMGDRAKRISAANLHERLPVANKKDELGNLAIVFNELLDRLDIEFDRQRRFMADASHELRTPVAIIRGESEVALLKNTRTSDEYQESLSIVNDEGKRLTKIVEDLFTLTRADSGEITANLRELYLDELVSDCVRSIRTLADKRNITIEFQGEETLIKGDETLLRRLFLNLFDNAVKYNIDGGSIRIKVADGAVTISNTGDAIPGDQQGSIFDRFYRVDKARSRNASSPKDPTAAATTTDTSGAGLGLSIAKWIADLHHAEIRLVSSDRDGNVFLVRFIEQN
ncbi:MAG: ATP-binding protein [Acidobacteriota bacterium]